MGTWLAFGPVRVKIRQQYVDPVLWELLVSVWFAEGRGLLPHRGGER